MNDLINGLLTYGLNKNIITDLNQAKQNLITLFEISDFEYQHIDNDIFRVLDSLLDIAYNKKLFNPNTSMERDQFEALIFDKIMPSPNETKATFKHLFNSDENQAIKYLYNLSIDVNYIKSKRTSQNLKWVYQSSYGKLELTINLSKPEKDPKDIAKALEIKNQVNGDSPQCVLCKENEHRYENARMNLRIVPMTLFNQKWHFQYSPYAYFNEHAIILSDEHRDMKLSCDTFEYLLDFVDLVPNYFIGSNADLSIVGGSILNHDHFQAGNYKFPVEDSKTLKTYENIKNISIEHLNWPLSTIKLISMDRLILSDFACHLLKSWKIYSNPKLEIIAKTDKIHQTITPILRKENGIYALYLILRNNRTNKAYPDGIFHPHPEVHHIKKENIGLIEAMGLAILPGRLKTELIQGYAYIKDNIYHKDLDKHKDWLDALKRSNQVHSIEDLYQEVGKKFEEVLNHSGVFKLDNQGKQAMDQFILNTINTYKKM